MLTVDVDLLQHGAQLLGPRELPQRAHHPPELLLRDAPVPVLVEQSERFPEFWKRKEKKLNRVLARDK